MIRDAFFKLKEYTKNEGYQGYDPYDTLNSVIPFSKFGKWAPIIAIQIQKRNPINIRKIIGIKKYNATYLTLFITESINSVLESLVAINIFFLLTNINEKP